LAATRLITSRLFGVKPAHPLVIVLATTLMIAVAAVGGFLPAYRAFERRSDGALLSSNVRG
jgi:ABC-type antimicrobial peptide transport system permease subunit